MLTTCQALFKALTEINSNNIHNNIHNNNNTLAEKLKPIGNMRKRKQSDLSGWLDRSEVAVSLK